MKIAQEVHSIGVCLLVVIHKLVQFFRLSQKSNFCLQLITPSIEQFKSTEKRQNWTSRSNENVKACFYVAATTYLHL